MKFLSFFRSKPKIETLEERNKRFEAMMPCEKRIAIAKDVIAQVRSQKFVAEQGTYIRAKGYKYEDRVAHKDKVDELLQIEGVTCNVCAKGAVFMSYVMKTGGCDVSDANHSGTHTIAHKLKDIFDSDQLDLMESAFERSPFGRCDPGDAVRFGRKYGNSHDRLIAIMENVIENKGTFKPNTNQ